MLKRLLAKNDDAYPEIVIALTFTTLLGGIITTGFAIVLATQPEQATAFSVFTTLAVISWTAFGITAYKYGNVRG